MSFVVDSSIAVAWLLPDEQSPATDALASRLEDGTAVAPALWLLEVGNALLTAQRRKRLTDREVDRSLGVLTALPIDVESSPPGESLAVILALARKLGLTAYDAVYVELAHRRRLPLATLDVRLAEGARKIGLEVLP
jgi:predicted nucleic acid-binding protein